jgi:hypothetical protein
MHNRQFIVFAVESKYLSPNKIFANKIIPLLKLCRENIMEIELLL